MTTWIIKSETEGPDDPDRALANISDLRSKGYTAWIEDENGKTVDEDLLKRTGRVAIERTLLERLTGPLIVVASAVAGLLVLYLLDFWIG